MESDFNSINISNSKEVDMLVGKNRFKSDSKPTQFYPTNTTISKLKQVREDD